MKFKNLKRINIYDIFYVIFKLYNLHSMSDEKISDKFNTDSANI